MELRVWFVLFRVSKRLRSAFSTAWCIIRVLRGRVGGGMLGGPGRGTPLDRAVGQGKGDVVSPVRARPPLHPVLDLGGVCHGRENDYELI